MNPPHAVGSSAGDGGEGVLTIAPPPEPGLLHRLSTALRGSWAVGLCAVLSSCALIVLVQRLDAPVALALSLLPLAALAMLIRPELATLLTIFLLYINFPAVLTKQHGLPHALAGAFILLLGFPLVRSLVIRRQPLRTDAVFHLMLLFLGVSLVSSLGAVDKGLALATVQEYVLEGLLLYWLTFNVIQSLATLRRVIWTLLVAGALVSSLSLYQTLTGSYEQEFGGLAYRNFEAVEAEQDLDATAKRRTWDRAGGPLNEPNRFAQVLIVLVPLAIFAYRNPRSWAARPWAAGLGMLILAGIALTLSRGAVLTLILMAVTMVALRWVRMSRAVVFALLFLIAAPAVPFFAERMTSVVNLESLVGGDPSPQPREVDTSSLARITVMLAALHVYKDHPVVGVGPGQFPPFYSQRYSRDPEIKFRQMPPGAWRAHSLYLEIAAERGTIGLATFLGMVILLLRRLWKERLYWRATHPEASDLATALCVSLLAYQVTGIFLHLSYQPYYWLLLALCGAALHILALYRLPESRDPVGSADGQEAVGVPARQLTPSEDACLP